MLGKVYVRLQKVRQDGHSYEYVHLVQGYRDESGKVRHRVVANLGRRDRLKGSGALERLAGSFARLDPPLVGTRRELGPLLLVRHYLERLGLAAIIERALPGRGRSQLTTAEVVSALIANRLCAPAPLYDVAGWASSAAVHEVLGIPAMLLGDDRLGRALDVFAPKAEEIRGAAALAAIERFGIDVARLHLDLTALRVAGAYERSSLVGRGWSAERSIARQVQVLQAVTRQGIPLYVRPHPGAAAELSCVGEVLARLAQLLPPGLLVCADSVLGHVRNLCAADQAGLRFVVPLRQTTGFAARFRAEVGSAALEPLAYVSRRERDLPAERRTTYRGAIRPFAVIDPATGAAHRFRVAYIWSSDEEQSVRAARERALGAAEAALGRVMRGLGGHHYRTSAAVRDKVARICSGAVRGLLAVAVGEGPRAPTLVVARNASAIAGAAELDGIYALATNLGGEVDATQILRLYKDQSQVERRHRDLKGTLRVRPIFLHKDERIAALVSIVGLAALVFGLIEHELRTRLGADDLLGGLLPERRSARPTGRNVLAALQGLGLTYTHRGLVVDPLTPTQRRIHDALQIQLPWPERAA